MRGLTSLCILIFLVTASVTGNADDKKLQIAIKKNGKMYDRPLDSAFRSGDRIKFLVKPNQNGYLYVYHRGPEGKVSVFFPMKASGGKYKDAKVNANEITVVPDKKYSLQFNKNTGDEEYTFVFRNKPQTVPYQDFKIASRSTTGGKAITNYAAIVKGQPPKTKGMNIVLDEPEQAEEEKARFVSISPQDPKEKEILYIFRLKHE